WLHLPLVSSDRFTAIYGQYFTLSDLRAGRLLNLTIALPIAYAALTRAWWLARPLETLLVTLGQRSLGAFVLHVYGLLLLANLTLPYNVLFNTIVQVALVVGIAALLNAREALRHPRVESAPARPVRIAA